MFNPSETYFGSRLIARGFQLGAVHPAGYVRILRSLGTHFRYGANGGPVYVYFRLERFNQDQLEQHPLYYETHTNDVVLQATTAEEQDALVNFFAELMEQPGDDDVGVLDKDLASILPCVYTYHYAVQPEWIKVGFTNGDPHERIEQQTTGTGIPFTPTVLGVWPHAHARDLEEIIKRTLTTRGRRIEKKGTAEWFITNLNEIQDIIDWVLLDKSA